MFSKLVTPDSHVFTQDTIKSRLEQNLSSGRQITLIFWRPPDKLYFICDNGAIEPSLANEIASKGNANEKL